MMDTFSLDGGLAPSAGSGLENYPQSPLFLTRAKFSDRGESVS
jgi:hypothetical protein